MIALQIIIVFVAALIVSLSAVPLVLRLATTYRLFDHPDQIGAENLLVSHQNTRQRIHGKPIPRLGGVAIALGFFFTSFFLQHDPSLLHIVLASIGVFIVGFIDDIRSLPASHRLILQATLAGYAIEMTGLSVKMLALSPDVFINLPHWLGFSLGIFIIVGAINSINMIDGLDGLAGGIVLIGIVLLSFIYFLRTHEVTVLLCLSFPMIGAVLGFLKYNTHPASIFMGDGGSNWLGFMLGILFLVVLGDLVPRTVSSDMQSMGFTPAAVVYSSSKAPLISVILCLAIPVFDSFVVIISRLSRGLSPMSPDNRHFHHALLRLGFTHSQSVASVYFLAVTAGIAGVLPIAFPQYNFSWLPYLFTIGLFYVLFWSSRTTFNLGNGSRGNSTDLDKLFYRPTSRISRISENINKYTMYSIIVVSPAFAGVVRTEIGFAALLASFLLLFLICGKTKGHDFIDSLALSLATVVLLVANNQNTMTLEIMGQRQDVQMAYNSLFILLVASTGFSILSNLRKRFFIFAPSDFLLISLPMLLLLVPQPFLAEYKLNIICLRSLVVFMALRTIAKKRSIVIHKIRLVAFFALLFVAMTSLAGLRIVY